MLGLKVSVGPNSTQRKKGVIIQIKLPNLDQSSTSVVGDSIQLAAAQEMSGQLKCHHSKYS